MKDTVSVAFMAKTDNFQNGISKMSRSTKGFVSEIAQGITGLAAIPKKIMSTLAHIAIGFAAAALGARIFFVQWQKGGAMTSFLRPFSGQINYLNKQFDLGIAKIKTLKILQKENIVRSAVHSQLGGMIGAGLAIGGAAIVASLGKAALSTADFESEMRNLDSILNESEGQFQSLSKEIVKMSAHSTQSAQDLSKGGYSIASAGFTKSAQLLTVLDAAQKAAGAGLTDTKTAAEALVTAMNAYGLSAGDATHVSDILFTTVKTGQTNFAELSQSMAEFVGLGHAAGVSMEELFATFANIANATGNPARSATSLQAAIQALITPTTALTSVYKSYGFESGQAMIKSLGFQKTIMTLDEAAGHNATTWNTLIPNIEALRAIYALTGQDVSKLNGVMDQFTDKSKLSGATQEALAKQMKGLRQQLAVMKNVLTSLAIQFGNVFLPILKMLVSPTISKAIGAIPQPIKSLISIFAGLSGTVLLLAGSFLFLRMKLTPVFTMLTTFGGLKKISEAIPTIASKWQMLTGFKGFGNVVGKINAVSTALGGLKQIIPTIGIAVAVAMAAQPITEWTQGLRQGKSDVTGLHKVLIRIAQDGAIMGKNFEDFRKKADMKQSRSTLDTFRNNLHIFSEKDSKKFVNQMNTIDKALALMVSEGNAKEAAKDIQLLATSLGISPEELLKSLPHYKDAQVDLAAATDLSNQKLREQQSDLFGLADPTTAATDTLQKYVDMLKAAYEATKTYLGLPSVVTEAQAIKQMITDAADEADRAKDAQQKMKDLAKDINDLSNPHSNDRKRAVLDVISAEKELRKVSMGGPAISGSDRDLKIQEAQQKLSDAKQNEIDISDRLMEKRRELKKAEEDDAAAKKKAADAANGDTFSLENFISALQKKTTSIASFDKNLLTLAGPQFKFGKAELDKLRAMGPEGMELAKKLVGASPEQVSQIKALLGTSVQQESEEANRTLDLQLAAAVAIANKNGKATADAYLEEIKRIAPGITAQLPEIQKALNSLPGGTGTTVPPELGTPKGPIAGPPNKATQGVADKKAGDDPHHKNPKVPYQGRLTPTQVQMYYNQPGGPTNLLKNYPSGMHWITAGPEFGNDSFLVGQSINKIYDRGGVLKPGTTIAQNNSGRDEFIFTEPQLRRMIPAMTRGAGGGGYYNRQHETNFNIGALEVSNWDDFTRKAERKKRLASLQGIG